MPTTTIPKRSPTLIPMSTLAIHPTAICDSLSMGEACTVGAYTLVASGSILGNRVRIGNHASVAENVHLADGVTIGDGARLGAGVVVAEGVRVDAQAVILTAPESLHPTRLLTGARIGAHATIHPGITVGQGAIVESGAVVRQDVQAHAVVSGNPAVVTGFAGTHPSMPGPRSVPVPEVSDSPVRGVRTYQLPVIIDPRGNLSVGEFEETLPFRPRRFFMTFEVPGAHVRGEHAHKECHQFMLCVRGACSVVVDDGNRREEYRLDTPTFGVHVPPLVWAAEYKHSPDSVLVVFASHHYDPADYIRDYTAFLEAVGGTQ